MVVLVGHRSFYEKIKKNHQIVTEGIFYVLWYSDIHKIMRWWREFSYHLDHCRACTSSPLDPSQCPVLTPVPLDWEWNPDSRVLCVVDVFIALYFRFDWSSIYTLSFKPVWICIPSKDVYICVSVYMYISIKHKWTHTQVCFNSFLNSNSWKNMVCCYFC